MSNCSPGSTFNPDNNLLRDLPGNRRKYPRVSKVQLRLVDSGFFLGHICCGRKGFSTGRRNALRPCLGIFVVRFSLREPAARFQNILLSRSLGRFGPAYGCDIGRCGSICMVIDLLRDLFLHEQHVIAGDVILRLYVFRLRLQDASMSGSGFLFGCLNRCFSVLISEDVDFNWLELSTDDTGTSIFELLAAASAVSSVA